MRYLEKLEESSKKKVEKARKLERRARAGTAPKGRAYKAAYKAASSISRGRVSGVAKAVNSLINQRRSELSEAEKRPYTFKEIDAYARGRENATMARRKKEFQDFYSDPKKKKKKAKLEEAKKKRGRCWTGYKPKPGSVPYSKGSCIKEAYKLIGLALIEAKVDKGKPYGEKTRARAKRDFDRAYQHASDTGEGRVGKMIRSKDFRKTAVLAARARRKAGEGDRPLAKLAMKEAYTMLGDVLAEAMSGKAKRVAGRLRTSANKIYKDAEVGEASGESPKSVAKKSARAHKRMKTAQDIESKS